ncbi:hypothetical protein DYB25_005254 [Aphanomyces astaci]|uniref:Uncharacterized protein n=1 Tax=Aphanomyces astaci TaxID=112090 RepID=A0A397DNP1_APHAT|nr:hypothetical protein DYB25_005254 [Aphanomyces astaci]RHY57081.1 hypothetical protein DYB34_000517 [Aphanomyces astaci]RHY64864.1 hypothetical protein DYB38_004732 [Aphanomyces astaci]RHY67630.1 hypothetical protein DYB30_004590 [Aphanomyces astaci]RHZ10083.1 hypothetical protein DYB26_008775 [Aphanomyces astaci]
MRIEEKQSVQSLKQQLEQTQVEIDSLKRTYRFISLSVHLALDELGQVKGEAKRLSAELKLDKASTKHSTSQANQRKQADDDGKQRTKQLEEDHQVEV